jgi:hypothetical protein
VATGILWSVIIGLWAAYLVPLWIARHDTSRMDIDAEFDDADGAWSPGDHADYADHADGGVAHVRYDGALDDAGRDALDDAGRDALDAAGRGRTGRRPAPSPLRRHGARVRRLLARRRARLAARRRRTLLGLVITLLVMVIAVPLGPMPGWAAGAEALVLAGYVVHLRRQARRAELMRAERLARARRHPQHHRPTAPAPGRTAPPRQAPTERRRSRGGPTEPTKDSGSPEDAQEPARGKGAPRRPDDSGLWQPLPVPLPTYVTRPRAIHPARAVELARATAWSSARLGSGVSPHWHAAPTGPALSVGTELPAAVSSREIAGAVAYVARAATPLHRPRVRRAVGD